MGCTGGPPAPHTKSSEIPVLVQKEKDFLKTRPYAPLPRTNIVQIVGRGRGCCPVVDNSKKKKKKNPNSKKEKEKKQTHPSPTTPQQDGQLQSPVPQRGEVTRRQK